MCAIDANGLGIGLIDFLTKSQIDEKLNKCKKCGMKSVIIQPWMKWYESNHCW